MSQQDKEVIKRIIAGGLRSAIRNHGPIDDRLVPSALKRIVGNLVYYLEQKKNDPENKSQ